MIKNLGSFVVFMLMALALLCGLKPADDATEVTFESVTDTLNIENPIGPKATEPLLMAVNDEPFSPHLGKSFDGFKEALGFKESQGNYFTVNPYGYLGKYQFGKGTLSLIGVYNITQFLENPALQEKAFVANASRNKWVLRRDIKRFEGQMINGVNITESGILAAAHLAGPGSVKKFLRSYGQENFADAFGTTVSYYMKRFAGYDTSLIKPNRRAKVNIKAGTL